MEYSLNVLIIDDEEVVRETIKAAMDFLGHKAILAETGQQGIDLFSKHKDMIDVVLLDSNMPGVDGLSVLNEIKKIKDCVDVVLMSGFVDDDIVKMYNEAGVKKILPKPFDLTSLSNIITEIHQEKLVSLKEQQRVSFSPENKSTEII